MYYSNVLTCSFPEATSYTFSSPDAASELWILKNKPILSGMGWHLVRHITVVFLFFRFFLQTCIYVDLRIYKNVVKCAKVIGQRCPLILQRNILRNFRSCELTAGYLLVTVCKNTPSRWKNTWQKHKQCCFSRYGQ